MKKRRGKPAGMNYADVLARKRMIRQAVQDEVILHEVNISMQRHFSRRNSRRRLAGCMIRLRYSRRMQHSTGR